MQVAVFGLGYVGAVTACCLARDGHRVVGVDISTEKVAMINAGLSPIVEPGLDDLLLQVVREGRLSATTDQEEALAASDVALICVGTPGQGQGQQDLRALTHVAQTIARASAGRTRSLTVVLRSTVLPGTTARVLHRILHEEGTPGAPIRIAMNPEFMREGSSLEDFHRPPFVLSGSDDPTTEPVIRQLYASVDAPFIHTTVHTAEMVKYVCNAYHALKVAFGNEIADLCDVLGADGQEVMRIACEDKKLNISAAYLTPGFAFGGSCLPKDVRALVAASRSFDVPAPLIAAIMDSNNGLIRRGIDAVLATRRRRIGIVGLAFKPTTDDLRESPMVTLVEALIGKGCDVRIYDPTVVLASLKGANRRYIESEIPHIGSLLSDDIESLLAHAEVLVFGSTGREAARVLAAATDAHTIVDLTHGALARQTARAAERGAKGAAEGNVAAEGNTVEAGR